MSDAPLTPEMVRTVEEQRLGFVASVSEDGTPNLSPKGTFVVLDTRRLAFGEIRSPNTLANLRRQPVLEVNFVDPFARKGFRAKGRARFVPRATSEFDSLAHHFERWGELVERINGFVILEVDNARALTSPAYDLGAEEAELRAHWQAHYANFDTAFRE